MAFFSRLSLFASLASVALASPPPRSCTPASCDNDYSAFLAAFAKTRSSTERAYRKGIFAANVQEMLAHNAAGHSWSMGVNQFSDMTYEEFSATVSSRILPPAQPRGLRASRELPGISGSGGSGVAASPLSTAVVDWATAGKTTPIKNQANCGSCYAFAATGVLESAFAIKNAATPVSLSDQQILDCSSSVGNLGCNGGYLGATLLYTQGGLCQTTAYPYTASLGTCKLTANPAFCTKQPGNIGYVDKIKPGRAAFEAQLQLTPVMIAINGGARIFQSYASGVLSPTIKPANCKSSTLNHAVVMIGMGYDASTRKYFYRIRNSWGTSWGESGYMRLEHATKYDATNGACGCESELSYPLL